MIIFYKSHISFMFFLRCSILRKFYFSIAHNTSSKHCRQRCGTLREKCPNTEFFSGPYVPVFGLNMEIYGVNLHIWFEYRKIRTRKNSAFGRFSRSGTYWRYFLHDQRSQNKNLNILKTKRAFNAN